MLSYRHGFHAGNHADVFKHSVLLFVLDYLCQKDKPLCYIDTHAGGGVYSLRDAYAEKNAEYKNGVEKIINASPRSLLLKNYRSAINNIHKKTDMFAYPGSPMLAANILRPYDRLQLCELHTSDFENLQKWAHGDKRILCKKIDGFEALKSYLPPREKRTLVLIDPSYEIKQDYQQVLDSLKEIHQRFSAATVILWYPLLPKAEMQKMERKLNKWPDGNWMNAQYALSARANPGMVGSGLFILNPPWTLEDALHEMLEEMLNLLALDDKANFKILSSST